MTRFGIRPIAKHRGASPDQLHRIVRGDLDWIVMKALEKDRGRRYETANALAEDVRRSLGDEPVTAHAPSAAYRFRKFARRNRVGLGVGVAIAAALILGIITTSWFGFEAARTSQELARKERELQSRVNDLRELMLEDAVANALGGDSGRAKEMVTRAQTLNAPADWSEMVGGLAALYRGDPQAAVSLLESIREPDIGTVAHKAALMTAYFHEGTLDKMFDAAAELRSASPKTFYDRLFKGQSFIYLDCRSAVADLREAVRSRPHWAFARMALAEALSELALESGESAHAREAVQLADLDRLSLPRNAYLLAIQLHANHVAMRMGAREHLNSPILTQKANEAAIALDAFPDFAYGRWLRALFYEYIGEAEKAEEDFRSTIRNHRGRLWQLLCGSYLYKIGKTDEAVPLKQSPWLYLDSPDDARRAMREYEEIMEASSDTPVQVRIWAQLVPIFAGDRKRATKEWAEMERNLKTRLFMLEWPLKLFAEKLTPDDLMRTAAHSGSRKQVAAAHYYIGVKCLCDGDTDTARRHFQSILDLDLFTDNIPHMAAGYLTRMERDQAWPHIIPKSSPPE